MRHQNAHLARGDSCLAARDAHRARGRKPEPRASAPRAPLQQPPMRHAYEYETAFSMRDHSGGARGGARSAPRAQA
jgi:hypothetical protein